MTPVSKAHSLGTVGYIDAPQTNMAVRRFQSNTNFLAPFLAPMQPVLKPTGQYWAWKMGDLNRDEMESRGPSAPPKVGSFNSVLQNFSTDARSLAFDLNAARAAAADVEIDPETMIPNALAYKALLHAERRLSSAFFASGKWHRTVTGAASTGTDNGTTQNVLYLDDAGQDPIEFFGAEIQKQGKLTGFEPVGLAFGRRLWHKVRNHAKVRATLTSGSTPVVRNRPASLDEMASLLELGWCGVSKAIHNTALEGETPSNDYIVPQDAALLYFAPTVGEENASAQMVPNGDKPSALARFVWNGVASDQGIQIRSYPEPNAGPGGSHRHVIDVYNGYGVVTPEMGTLFLGMVKP